MEFHVIIPARYASTRLPGKVLLDIAGKPMVQHVYEKALESGADSVVIATDHDAVRRVCEAFGATVCMTQETHQSGTERVAEAVTLMDYNDDDIIVNVQGDEPLIPSSAILQVAEELAAHDTVKMASLCQPITDLEELVNPNMAKVVLNHRRQAMYFSRAPIPWERDRFVMGKTPESAAGQHYRHIGIYAYRAAFLQQYVEMEACEAEQLEFLEQLRVLWHGGRIQMGVVKNPVPRGVDTEADLEHIRKMAVKTKA
jgi:3-deoxy-manno-octulosonate cytidylyltransferase (CMP-KDO synthetase)